MAKIASAFFVIETEVYQQTDCLGPVTVTPEFFLSDCQVYSAYIFSWELVHNTFQVHSLQPTITNRASVNFDDETMGVG